MDDFLHDEERPCLHSPPSPSPAEVIGGSRSRAGSLSQQQQQRKNSLRHQQQRHMVAQQQQEQQNLPRRMRPPNFNINLVGSGGGVSGAASSLLRLAKSIGVSVEMFAAVGETIGDDDSGSGGGGMRIDMIDACREARAVSSNLEKLCETLQSPPSHLSLSNRTLSLSSSDGRRRGDSENEEEQCLLLLQQHQQHQQQQDPEEEAAEVVRVLRRLLAAVTRILLLADNVVVKQVLVSKDIIIMSASSSAVNQSSSLDHSSSSSSSASFKTMHHFNEFVKAFCDFGTDMVQIVHIVIGYGDNQDRSSSSSDVLTRSEARRAQVDCARLILERSATLLLTSSKTFACYPGCSSARENRDTVFCQMRRALDLIHFIVKEGVVDCSVRLGLEETDPTKNEEQDRALESTVLKSVRYFEESVEIMRLSPVSDSYKDQLTSCLATIAERTQDFTDSAYTSHEHRRSILLQCDRAKVELHHLLRSMAHSMEGNSSSLIIDDDHLGGGGGGGGGAPHLPPEEVETAMRSLLKATTELRMELLQTAVENSAFLIQNCIVGSDLLMSVKDSALMGDYDRLQALTGRFSEHVDFVEDVAKLIRHVAQSESAQIRAKHSQINLRIYGPQVSVAAGTLCRDPHSVVAKNNLETFCTMWNCLIEDVIHITERAKQEAAAAGVSNNNNNCSSSGGMQMQQQQQGLLLQPPLITQQPPTPSQSMSPYPSMQQQQQSEISPSHSAGGGGGGNRLEVRGAPSAGPMMGPMGSRLQFRKSVPNLSTSVPSSFSSAGGDGRGGGGRDFLDPSSAYDPRGGNNAELIRRHSTSSVIPGQYTNRSSGGGGCSPEDSLNAYQDVENNEIVKRSRKMAGQANDMYDFTRGQGKVKTTQDLFTMAEFFAQEANVLYKVIRVFSYDVPTGEDKRSLMAIADDVPKHCHQLQMLIQSPIVGKAATFTKVDSIIQETRQIMQLVAHVVHVCYANANKYNLDFSNVSLEGRCSGGAGEDSSLPFGSSSGSGSGNTSGNDSS